MQATKNYDAFLKCKNAKSQHQLTINVITSPSADKKYYYLPVSTQTLDIEGQGLVPGSVPTVFIGSR